MNNLTNILHAQDDKRYYAGYPTLAQELSFGLQKGVSGERLDPSDWFDFALIRSNYGFKPATSAPQLLTPPDANLKLSKTFSYGLTLQSHSTKLSNGMRVNACPDAGRCVEVCVLNNGNGGFPVVQRSRDARTEYFATAAWFAMHQLGWELGRAIRKHGEITFRPNVNSDVRWLDIVPNLGWELGDSWCYGYTKHESPVAIDGYVEAYSLSEQTPVGLPEKLIGAGVSIAAVTDRKKGAPVTQWAQDVLGVDVEVVDADENDLWMVDAHKRGVPVIGDLSAKGKAQTLRRAEVIRGNRATGLFVQRVSVR